MNKTSNKLILGAAIFLILCVIVPIFLVRFLEVPHMTGSESLQPRRFYSSGHLDTTPVQWLESEDIAL